MTTYETTCALRSIFHILQLTAETKGKMNTVQENWKCLLCMGLSRWRLQAEPHCWHNTTSEIQNVDVHVFRLMRKDGNSFSKCMQPNSPPTVVPTKTWPSRRKWFVNKFERIPSFHLCFIFTTGKASWYPLTFWCVLDSTCHKNGWVCLQSRRFQSSKISSFSKSIMPPLCPTNFPGTFFEAATATCWSKDVFSYHAVEEKLCFFQVSYSAILRYLRLSSSSDQISEELLMSLKTRMYKLFKPD